MQLNIILNRFFEVAFIVICRVASSGRYGCKCNHRIFILIFECREWNKIQIHYFVYPNMLFDQIHSFKWNSNSQTCHTSSGHPKSVLKVNSKLMCWSYLHPGDLVRNSFRTNNLKPGQFALVCSKVFHIVALWSSSASPTNNGKCESFVMVKFFFGILYT